jgi:hypothetical protein
MMKTTLSAIFGRAVGFGFRAAAGAVACLAFQIPALAEVRDVTARNCEIFVDRIQLARETDGTSSLTYLIKVNPSQLDGEIVDVMVYHARQEFTVDSARSGFAFRTDWLSPIRDDDFVFSHTVVAGNEWLKAREYASYYVETDTGTRYWLNAEQKAGQEFMTDWTTFDLIVDQMADYHGVMPFEYISRTMRMSAVPHTADGPQDVVSVYNPGRCH